MVEPKTPGLFYEMIIGILCRLVTVIKAPVAFLVYFANIVCTVGNEEIWRKKTTILRIFRFWASLFLSDLDKEIYGISPKWTIHLYDFYSHPLKRFTLSLVPVGPGGFCQILRGRFPKSILGQTPRFAIVQKSSGMICNVHPEFTILQFSPSCQNTFMLVSDKSKLQIFVHLWRYFWK